MKTYKLDNIVIGLDQSDMDIDIVKAAGFICDIVSTKHLYFVNVIPDFSLPDDLLLEFPR